MPYFVLIIIFFILGLVLAHFNIPFIFFIIGLIAFVINQVATEIKAMLTPQDLFFSIDKDINLPENTRLQKEFEKADTWIKNKGFQFDSCLFQKSKASSQLIRIYIWMTPDRTVNFVMIDHLKTLNKINFIFESKFENGYSLNTTTIDIFYPYPHNFCIQSFPNKNLEQLWTMHIESENTIQNQMNTIKKSISNDMLFELKKDTKELGEYLTNIFAWQLRIPYWIMIRKLFVRNKKIHIRSNMN